MDSTSEEVALWEKMVNSPNTWIEATLPLRMLLIAKISKWFHSADSAIKNYFPGGAELESSNLVDKYPHPLSLMIAMQASPSQFACIALIARLKRAKQWQRDVWCQHSLVEQAREIELLLLHQRKSHPYCVACNLVIKMLAGHINRKITGKATERDSWDGVEKGKTAAMTENFIIRQLLGNL